MNIAQNNFFNYYFFFLYFFLFILFFWRRNIRFSPYLGYGIWGMMTAHLPVTGHLFQLHMLIWGLFALGSVQTVLLSNHPPFSLCRGRSAHAWASIIWFADHRRPWCDTVSQTVYRDILYMINPLQLSAGKISASFFWCSVSELKVFEIIVLSLMGNLRKYYLRSEFLVHAFWRAFCKLHQAFLKYPCCFSEQRKMQRMYNHRGRVTTLSHIYIVI